jgi:hypothetical protein
MVALLVVVTETTMKPEAHNEAYELDTHSTTTLTTVLNAPKDFRGTEPGESCDVWVPLAMYRQAMTGIVASFDVREFCWLELVGRLKPGVHLDQARAEMSSLARQLELACPKEHRRERVGLIPKFKYRPDEFEVILCVAVALLLFIACANVANLLLAQVSARRLEIAIRGALGARRGRLIRQLLAEEVLIWMLGGAAALLAALWMARPPLPFLAQDGYPVVLDLSPDMRVLGFTFAVSLLSGVAFTLAPALQACKPGLVPALKDTPGGVVCAKSRLRSLLVISQVSLSLALLVEAGLLLRALRNFDAVKPGFESRNALLVSLEPGLQGYDLPQLNDFYRRLLERAENPPGVEASSLATDVLAGGFFHAYRVDAHDGVAYSLRRITTRDTPLPDFPANLLEFQRLFLEEAACLRYPGDDRARRRRTRCLTRGRALGVNPISMDFSTRKWPSKGANLRPARPGSVLVTTSSRQATFVLWESRLFGGENSTGAIRRAGGGRLSSIREWPCHPDHRRLPAHYRIAAETSLTFREHAD